MHTVIHLLHSFLSQYNIYNRFETNAILLKAVEIERILDKFPLHLDHRAIFGDFEMRVDPGRGSTIKFDNSAYDRVSASSYLFTDAISGEGENSQPTEKI